MRVLYIQIGVDCDFMNGHTHTWVGGDHKNDRSSLLNLGQERKNARFIQSMSYHRLWLLCSVTNRTISCLGDDDDKRMSMMILSLVDNFTVFRDYQAVSSRAQRRLDPELTRTACCARALLYRWWCWWRSSGHRAGHLIQSSRASIFINEWHRCYVFAMRRKEMQNVENQH